MTCICFSLYICNNKNAKTNDMKTLKQIMTEAHQIAKTMEGDYSACLSESLRISWQNAKENFTPDFIKIENFNLNDKTTKELFDIIYLGYNFSNEDYNILASAILEVVKTKSNGFQKDIATKAFNGEELTQKQSWCIAFEFKKVA